MAGLSIGDIISGERLMHDQGEWAKGKQLSTQEQFQIEDMISLMKELENIRDIKMKGYNRPGDEVDTGPWRRVVPNFLQTLYNKNIEGMGEKEASSATKLEQALLDAINPKRSKVTGAGAAESEIRNWIAPTMAGINDTNPDFKGKLLESYRKANEFYKDRLINTIEQDKRVGPHMINFDISDPNALKKRLSDFEKILYGE